MILFSRIVIVFGAVLSCAVSCLRAESPLAAWRDGDAAKAVVQFVEKVTREGSADFVPVADRIAVFDNDGTLWCEQPFYVQLAFAVDRVAALFQFYLVGKRCH